MGGQKSFDTDCWIKFLLSHGLKETSSKGSHHKFTKPGIKRPFIVRPSKKTTPERHIANSIQELGCTKWDFIAWAAENC